MKQLEKMRFCGGKGNARIEYGYRTRTQDKFRYYTSHWFCLDHFKDEMTSAFKNDKVKVKYPLILYEDGKCKVEEETFEEHWRKRSADDYWKGDYSTDYSCRFK